MRFTDRGPPIPDELLLARDEGRVVFFCGAGVSRAKVRLPDFFGLAEKVIKRLRVPPESAARKTLVTLREMDAGMGSLISADRIFGLLEREFSTSDIDAAVAMELRPAEDADLSAHKLLLRLSRTPDGRVKLITTNFDRLFEACDPALRIWHPPRLPDPIRYDEFEGVIHLHGIVNDGYTGSDGDAFVLTTSEFGRAYLGDGWATSFFKSIIERFVVVFLGYQADDPPVQYLLEALNKTAGGLDAVYAFQSGLAEDAIAKWQHKGVRAIPYAHSADHADLWDTLAAWAERADNPDEWLQSRIDLAKQGPRQLRPYERGQVAHVVSTLEGSRQFSSSEQPPPAEWLCVFDPWQRYATPARGRRRLFEDDEGQLFDPFAAYNLDSDLVPSQPGSGNPYERRVVPPSAWDCFALNLTDRKSLSGGNFAELRGHWAVNAPRLVPRLAQLGIWIRRVAHEPTAVWWAANQMGLHPELREQILWALDRNKGDASLLVKECWQYLFEAWSTWRRNPEHDQYRFPTDQEAWSTARVRRYAAISRPYLTVEQSWPSASPPVDLKEIERSDLLRLDVRHPNITVDIPLQWLPTVIGEMRKNLELARQLETEIGGFALGNISPIIPDPELEGDAYERTHGLSASVILFASVFERFASTDLLGARRECSSWPSDDDEIFARLRIWAAGLPDIVDPRSFSAVILSLSDDAFWDPRHQRDLLVALSNRWASLDTRSRKALEKRLLTGGPQSDGEEKDRYEARKAWMTLSRFEWLVENGCQLTFSWPRRRQRLRKAAPEWKPKYGLKAAGSLESRGGAVKTETGYSNLLNLPLGNVLAAAVERGGRSEDFLIEHDPFRGLSTDRPNRAFGALILAAKRGEYPEWAWRTFLNPDVGTKHGRRLKLQIAKRLASFEDAALASMIRPASNWLLEASSVLAAESQTTFDTLFSRLTTVLATEPPGSGSALVRGNSEPDWTMEALNSPAGKLAQAFFNDPRVKRDTGLDPSWRDHCDDLLRLPDEMRRQALVIFAHNLRWFFWRDKPWTEAQILSVIDDGPDDDRNAVWSGFLWAAKIANTELYVRMKPGLLALAKLKTLRKRGYEQNLAGMILAGWGSARDDGERYVSNSEMHDALLQADDEFRTDVLWNLERWAGSASDERVPRWVDLVGEFLSDVWPRQRAAKTTRASARLVDLLFSNSSKFPEWADLALPLLTPVTEHLMIPHLDEENGIASQHPEKSLAILYAVLPDDTSVWPYRIETVFRRIQDAQPALQHDGRLIELWRKWNSR